MNLHGTARVRARALENAFIKNMYTAHVVVAQEGCWLVVAVDRYRNEAMSLRFSIRIKRTDNSPFLELWHYIGTWRRSYRLSACTRRRVASRPLVSMFSRLCAWRYYLCIYCYDNLVVFQCMLRCVILCRNAMRRLAYIVASRGYRLIYPPQSRDYK